MHGRRAGCWDRQSSACSRGTGEAPPSGPHPHNPPLTREGAAAKGHTRGVGGRPKALPHQRHQLLHQPPHVALAPAARPALRVAAEPTQTRACSAQGGVGTVQKEVGAGLAPPEEATCSLCPTSPFPLPHKAKTAAPGERPGRPTRGLPGWSQLKRPTDIPSRSGFSPRLILNQEGQQGQQRPTPSPAPPPPPPPSPHPACRAGS